MGNILCITYLPIKGKNGYEMAKSVTFLRYNRVSDIAKDRFWEKFPGKTGVLIKIYLSIGIPISPGDIVL